MHKVPNLLVSILCLLFTVYRGEDGKPYSLPVVSSVEKAMAQDKTLNHEYLPIAGMKDLCEASTKLALGSESTAITQNRVSIHITAFYTCNL